MTALPIDSFLTVQTQYHRLANDKEELPAKIPDVVMHLSNGFTSELVFIESKVSSGLSGDDQLQLSARILSSRSADRQMLLFISRDYLPQDPNDVFALVPKNRLPPHFAQSRWAAFARFWRINGLGVKDPLSTELLSFMKEFNLTQETQFTPHALAALGGFHQAFDILRAVLDEELRARVKEVSGSVRDDYDTMTAVARERMFVLRSRPENLWITIGFWLPADEEGYPWAFGDVCFGHKSAGKSEILSALREYAASKPLDWEGDSLSDTAPSARIMRQRSLASFLGEPNHVDALKKFFGSVLDDIAAFRDVNPTLLWQVGRTE